MLHQIEDESGQVWYVGKDDPCHRAVQILHTQHYTWVVLPRILIQGLRLTLTVKQEEEAWNLKHILRKAHQIGYNSQGGRRHIRLAECLKVLEG